MALRAWPWARKLACAYLWLATATAGFAAIPEPDAIVYGTAALNGYPVSAGYVVAAKIGTTTLVSYTVGSNPTAGGLFALRVPLESTADGSTPSATKARVGNQIAIYVNGADTGTRVTIAERGSVTQVNVTAASGDTDLDDDGIPDWMDNCGGSPNASQLDTNGNGIGDACEGAVNPPPTLHVVSGGNAADTETGLGEVPYEFSILETEVTNAQYRDFLTATATQSDPNGAFNPLMGTDPRGGISRIGSAPSFAYTVRPNMGNKPVNFVSWLDAARYSNWLANGSPTGAPGPTTTEDGAFDLSVSAPELLATPTFTATWSLPTEDEWYKSAYYDPALSSYSDFPTKSNVAPVLALANQIGDVSNPGTNVANYQESVSWAAQIGNVSSVGTTGSPSGFGTSDQGGNVGEWLADLAEQGKRVTRGGDFSDAVALLRSNAGSGNRSDVLTDPIYEGADVGFRVVSLPNPDPDQDGIPSFGFFGPCTAGNVVACNDNCPNASNPTQADTDTDGVGNDCDLDFQSDPTCSDGIDNDDDGGIDYPADKGCTDAADSSERGTKLCDNGADDDGDGLTDFPADPGCKNAIANLEKTQCQDGLDNDGQTGIDFDGGASLDQDQNGFIDLQFNAATPAVGAVDPQCTAAWVNSEAPAAPPGPGCGIGPELIVALGVLLGLRSALRRD